MKGENNGKYTDPGNSRAVELSSIQLVNEALQPLGRDRLTGALDDVPCGRDREQLLMEFAPLRRRCAINDAARLESVVSSRSRDGHLQAAARPLASSAMGH